MAEKKGVPNASKIAMSRALGAAFLNHQVEQLEKTVSSNGPASGNWRDRRSTSYSQVVSPSAKRAPITPTANKSTPMKKRGAEIQVVTKDRDLQQYQAKNGHPTADTTHRRNSSEGLPAEKDADIVVVDASLLIHGLEHIKRWSRNGREEVVIVPLEALNTLDLLKKGSSALAQRARAASRVLEAQVGTNPRIRVQRDDAFVLWDKIAFAAPVAEQEEKTSPEWVRRTICCARWELDNAANPSAETPVTSNTSAVPTVVMAVCTANPSLSPQSHSLKLTSDTESPLTPVPLPAPLLVQNKHEPRCTGSLVAYWAARAGLHILDVRPTSLQPAGNPRSSSEDERPKRNIKGRRPPQNLSPADGGKGLVERSPAVLAMMEMVSHPSKVVRVLARGEKLDPD